MTWTYADALARAGVTVPPHLIAQAEVPVLAGPQAQGDLLVVPEHVPDEVSLEEVADEGIAVVTGETGNTHWLHRGPWSPGVRWGLPAAWTPAGNVLGWVAVPPGETAYLVHTDEHGANAIGPGTYAVRRKRETTGWVED